MKTIGERLKAARESAGFKSARAAAIRFRWKPSTYAAHENGQNKFNEEDAKDYARAFRTSAGWILTAEGEPPKRLPQPDIDPDYEPLPESGIREIDVRAGLGGGGTTDGRQVVHHGDVADPVKSEAWHFPDRFMREELRAPEDRVVILETQGDSMSPTILSGDRVIVDMRHVTPSPDGIYALRDGYGTIVVKRLQLMRGGSPTMVKIISDNPHHTPQEVPAEEIEGSIIGRVLWGLKRL